MRRRNWILTVGAAVIVCGCAAAPKGEPLTCRPRLFFRPVEWEGGLSVAQLRARAAESPFKERAHLLRTTIANLAMKWLIDGDEQAAAEALARMRKWNRKVVDSEDGTQLIDLALGYDWLYEWPGFTDADKDAVEAKMVRLASDLRGYLAGSGAHVFHTRMYSWCAGVGVAGLALHDTHPAGRGLFHFAKDYYETRLVPARKLQGGAVHNGFLYAFNYTMFPTLQFLKAMKSAAGVDYFHTANPADSDWLREMPYFMIYGTQPDLKTVRYADLTTDVPSRHFRYALDIFAAEYQNGYAAHLADLISEKYQTSGYHAEWIYLFLAFHDPTVAPKPFDDLPAFRVFSREGLGHVFFKSDWSDSGALVHFRCGDYFGDHGHFDQGAFTVFKRERLAIKAGFYDFSSDHRLHFYKQAVSTNTMIFNDPADTADEGRQRNVRYQEANTVEEYLLRKYVEPFVETGSILAADDPAWATCTSRSFHAVSADVTQAWDANKVKRHVRHLAFVDGEYLVVVDETEVTAPTIRARFLLHTRVEPKREVLRTAYPAQPLAERNQTGGRGAAPVGEPRHGGAVWAVRDGSAVLYVQPVLPAEPTVTLIGGPGRECEVNGVNWTYLTAPKYVRTYKPKPDAKPVPDLGLWRMEIEHPQPALRRLFVTVLTATDARRSPAPLSATQEGSKLVVHIGETRVTFHQLWK